MTTEKKLYIPIWSEDLTPYYNGLWNHEQLGKFMAGIADFARTGERPQREAYQETLEDKYMYVFLCQAIERIEMSWEKYAELSAKRSEIGRKGGISSGKTRAKKKAADFVPEEEDLAELDYLQADTKQNEAIASRNRSKTKQNEANEAMNKNINTPVGTLHMSQTGGKENFEKIFLTEESLNDLTWEDVQETAIKHHVDLSSDGLRRWYEIMLANDWQINGTSVTRKTMLRAMRGFAKNFPQWQQKDTDADQEPAPNSNLEIWKEEYGEARRKEAGVWVVSLEEDRKRLEEYYQ